jgi:hypothetical protein
VKPKPAASGETARSVRGRDESGKVESRASQGLTDQDGEVSGGAVQDQDTLQRVGKLAAFVLASASALAGLAAYFGVLYTRAFYNYLGVDDSVLRFSTRDYLIRSIDSLLAPILSVLIFGIAILLVDVLLMRWQSRPSWFALACVVIGASLLVNGLFIYLDSANMLGLDIYLQEPLSIVIGAALFGLGLRHASDRAISETTPTLRALLFFSVATIAACGILEATAQYADTSGARRAAYYTTGISDRPTATLTSDHPLYITGRGIGVITLKMNGQSQFRYTGLRFILESNDSYLFLNADWRLNNGSAYVIKKSPRLTLQLPG